jgi:hypothetical protein
MSITEVRLEQQEKKRQEDEIGSNIHYIAIDLRMTDDTTTLLFEDEEVYHCFIDSAKTKLEAI